MTEQCVRDFCPPATMAVTNTNGLKFCKQCSIEKCQSCIEIDIKQDSTVVKREICLKCKGGFTPSETQLGCGPFQLESEKLEFIIQPIDFTKQPLDQDLIT